MNSKRKTIVIVTLACLFVYCLVLAGCLPVHSHSFGNEWLGDDTYHWQQCLECDQLGNRGQHSLSWIVDKPATTSAAGSKHEECSVCHKVTSTLAIPQLSSSTRTVDFYAINDFHGSVDKISTVGGFLKGNKNSNANTVLLNSGDMFQGSMESNSNYGQLLTNCMEAIGFDAFTFGNHEFDWGLDNLKKLANNSNVPFLGANIYHWDAATKTWGTFASELAQKYAIKVLDNGLKVGIIGIIGEDQITSISSNLVQTIGFKSPLPIIKELATELRNEQNCDIVVVSAHVGPQALVGEKENNQKPSTAADLENYVDAVFCAHTHRQQSYMVDGIPFIQGGSYGNYISNVKLSVESNGKVNVEKQDNIKYSSSWDNLLVVDEFVDNANAQIEDERNQTLTLLDGPLDGAEALPRLVCRALAEYAVFSGYDIHLAMTNNARNSLSFGNLTYSQLYEAIPFDNVVYIAKVKGKDIIKEAGYSSNSVWRVKESAIAADEYYFIAVIDYLLFHQNSSRIYDYFPSAFTSGFNPVALTNDKYDVYNYRLITRDFILNNDIKTADYRSPIGNTSKELQYSTNLKYEPSGSWKDNHAEMDKHKGTKDDPLTVKEALAIAATGTSSQKANVYIKGYFLNSGNMVQGEKSGDLGNFMLGDPDGTTIYVYYLSKFEGASKGNNWQGVNDLITGDVVVVFAATLYPYNGIAQIGSGYCVSVNGVPTAS